MKKKVIGYIFYASKLKKEEKLFLKIAKKKNIDLVLFNLSKEIDDEKIEKDIKRCSLIFNNSAETMAIELIKTAEALGKKVIDSSKSFYFSEDKWIFFLKCKEHNIPTPETNFLSGNLTVLEKELKKFNHWPVILKRVEGTCGEYVEKADNVQQAIRIVKRFWKKGSERLPIIAQEMIESKSYRVTVIDGKIVQTAIKENKAGWKCTGVYTNIGNFKKFKVDRELKKIVDKVIQVSKIKICGIDLLKKGDKWMVLEVNAEPAFDFFENEREKLVSKTLDLLKKECNK
jgi:glutathione synthase/RimK-type ligase-like ATP-grasp enzyme